MNTFNASSSGVRLWDHNPGKAHLNGGIVYSRASAKDSSGRFCWSSGAYSCFTNKAVPEFQDPVFSGADSDVYSSPINTVTVPGSTLITIGGSGLLLQPVTELQYVSMTTSGGIVSNGNTLSLNGQEAWTDGGLSAAVSGEYCPLVKSNASALGGDLQYANMYTGGIASAVVSNIDTSTGYGTLLHALSTITSVRQPTGENSATNDYIPTERAVALALAGKENTVVGGSCIVIDKDVASTTIGVNVQTATITSVVSETANTIIPTERSVRLTVDMASGALNASASAISNRINTLSTYVANSTIKTTDSARSDFLGIVKPGTGLTVSSGGVLKLNKADVVTSSGGTSAYTSAWSRCVISSVGGVVCTDAIESAGLIKYEAAPIVPTVQAVYDYVSAHGGGGGAIVSHGTGITVTSDTPLTSYTVTLNPASASVIGGVQVAANNGLILDSATGALSLSKAGKTAATYGGVWVTGTEGLNVVTTDTGNSRGKLYITPATANAIGGVKIGTGLGMSGTNNDILYVTATGGLQSFTVASGTGIAITNSSTTGCTVGLIAAQTGTIGGVMVPANSGINLANDGTIKLSAATTTSIGGVIIGNSLDVDATGKVSYKYNGPFAVTYNETNSSAIISGGYINARNSVVSVGETTVSGIGATESALIYMQCSSGWVYHKAAEVVSNGGVYSINIGNNVFSRVTASGATTAECWSNGTTKVYTSLGLLPQSNVPVYSEDSLQTVAGYVSNYTYKMQVNVSSTGATSWSQVYYSPILSSYDSSDPDTLITAPFYLWSATSSASKFPDHKYLGTRDAFTSMGWWPAYKSQQTADPAKITLPTASAIFSDSDKIPIAEIRGGVVRQCQFGDITYDPDPHNYFGYFNVQRMDEYGTFNSATSVTYTSTNGVACDRYQIVPGANIYVGNEPRQLTGLIYGVPIGGYIEQWGIKDPYVFSSGTTGIVTSDSIPVLDQTKTKALGGTGVWIYAMAVEYPEFNGSKTETTPNVTPVTASWSDIDSLYLPKNAPMAQIWLNIFKGTTAMFPGVTWHAQLDSRCLENLDATKDRYSVLIAEVRNGKLYQVQSGAIDIRGRWS